MKIIREEKLNSMDVRQLCIRNEYFTCGDCLEYEKLFQMCDEYDETVESLKKIAEHIINNSAQDKFDPFEEYSDRVCGVMFDLIKYCSYSIFIPEVEND